MVKKTILFCTNPERGQCSVHLAVIAFLLDEHADELDVHIASYPVFRKLVPKGVTFHPVEGKSLREHYPAADDGTAGSTGLIAHMSTAPGMFGVMAGALKVDRILHPESPTDYLATALSFEQVIQEVKPRLVICDTLLDPAMDAARRLQVELVLLSPNTLKEVAMDAQESGIFRLPAPGVGYAYPVKWYLRITNFVSLLFFGMYLTVFSTHLRRLKAARDAAGYPGGIPIFAPLPEAILCQTHPLADYPMMIPDRVVCCGPIILPTPSLAQADPALDRWLDRGGRKTILIALGSHFAMDEAYAMSMLLSVKTLLAERPDVQVLWKLVKWGDYTLPLDDLAGYEGEAGADDRLRIFDWLDASPLTLMRSGKLAAIVHHGGSNSYHEALACGVPQMILSPWFDCHDFGSRAEWLGVGVWGNKKASPRGETTEMTHALRRLTGSSPDDEVARKYRERAREIAEVVSGERHATLCEKGPQAGEISGGGGKPEGRVVAAEWIWSRLQDV